ncbi:MAG: SEC-C domain-containing protein [Clostridia bacterium]|nr:SEC-C domain-containing protein [Clostridia bacterium]
MCICLQGNGAAQLFHGIEVVHPVGVNGTAPARTPKVGRNDPCPCGSGKKYKKCCGRGDDAEA